MNKIQAKLREIGSLFSLVPLLLLALLLPPASASAQSGLPFSANQFPVYWATQTTRQQAISNANEIVLFQTTLPRYVLGNNGLLSITTFCGSPDAAAATVTHAIKGYFGGTNSAIGTVWNIGGVSGSTPIFTNTFTTTAGQEIQQFLFPSNSAAVNFFYGTTTTNSFSAGDYGRAVSFGTQTNQTGGSGFLFTITGSAGGTGGATNIVNLDAIILEALGQP